MLKARWYLIWLTHIFQKHAKTTQKNPVILENTSQHFCLFPDISFQARLVAT